MEVVFVLELRHLTYTRMKVITSINVGDTLIAMIQHCSLDLLTITNAKNMAQGKDMENTSTMEAALGL